MKKKYWLYALFVGLLAVAVFTVFNRKAGTFKGNESQFAVRDTGKINIIEIKSKKDTVILERIQSGWKVNRTYSADNKKIARLLMVISRLQVSAPVPAAIKEEVRSNLAEKGKRVSVITDRKSQHRIVMYQDTVHTHATYMMLGESDQPFRVEIPGYMGRNLAGLFVDEPDYWRDNSIFRLGEDEIMSVAVFNRIQSEKSFYLVNNGNSGYKLFTYSDSTEIKDFDPGQVRQYLGYFASVTFERFLSDEEKADQSALKEDKPENIITVKDSRNNITKVATFPWYAPGHKEQSGPDLNRLIVVINDTDIVMARYIELDPVIKDIGYFLEKEKNNLYN
jgi:V8-like Glu-specific endopeptidase